MCAPAYVLPFFVKVLNSSVRHLLWWCSRPQIQILMLLFALNLKLFKHTLPIHSTELCPLPVNTNPIFNPLLLNNEQTKTLTRQDKREWLFCGVP